MKNLITLSFLTFILSQSNAQITVTNTYFPDNNDSLVTANAIQNHVNSTRISAASSVAQTWDFSYLRSAQNNTAKNIQRFRSINAATDTAILRTFPAANLVTADSSGNVQVYRRTTTRFELLGFSLQNFGNLPIRITPVFEPASLERRATLAFNSTNRNQTGFNLPLPISVLPDTIRNSLPIATDSIRIRFQTTRTDKVDAFGKISIGGLTNVDCLRERRYEISETKVELHIPRTTFWLDVTAVVFNGNRPAKDTTIEYNFWTNQYKEPLVRMRSENDSTATSISFKWLPLRTNLQNTEGSNAGFKIFPSPTNATLFLELDAVPNRTLIQISDILGRPILTKIVDTQSSQIDVSSWLNGLYFLKIGQQTKTFVVSR